MTALRGRSGGRCEICGAGDPLHIHHLRPWSRGGTHALGDLQLRCADCHRAEHLVDFREDPQWQAARDRAMAARPTDRLPEAAAPG